MSNQKVVIHAYKFDGQLYRTYEFGYIIEENDEYICVSVKGAHVIYEMKNRFYPSDIKENCIWYFFKKEWYNLLVGYKDNRLFYHFHVAGPYLIEEGAIKYIDFDLDYRVNNWKSHVLTELDIDEFVTHSLMYNYPPKLVDTIRNTGILIKKRYQEKYFDRFFNKELLEKQLP
ncbi:MAG: DUF402 domain-containing protein [Mycoplasmataceae bacterium]|nr:DUF402 domain-containing protein [Mycoplasmataceae bacterium]